MLTNEEVWSALSDPARLELPFTEGEVWSVLKDMNGEKAPGPDGFTAAFWQSS